MNRISLCLGYWSAVLCVVTFLVFMVCFVAISVLNPPFVWTNLPNFIQYSNQYNQSFKYVAQFSMLLFGALYVMLLNSVYDLAAEERKPLARLGLAFGLAFAVLSSLHYFVQLSAVRLSIESGRALGLEQFVQSNPVSAVAAINMLGWAFFFPLSSLSVSLLFSGSNLATVTRYAFLANGIICLIGGAGYLLNSTPVVFVTMNLGMGLSVLAATLSLAVLFRRTLRASRADTETRLEPGPLEVRNI